MLHQNKEAFLIQMVNLYWQPQIPDRSTGLATGPQDHPSYQLPATMGKLPFVWNQKAHFPSGTSASDTSQKKNKSQVSMYLKLEEETASNIINNDTKYHEYTYHQSISRGKNIHVCVWNSENKSPGVSKHPRFKSSLPYCNYQIVKENNNKLHIKKKILKTDVT